MYKWTIEFCVIAFNADILKLQQFELWFEHVRLNVFKPQFPLKNLSQHSEAIPDLYYNVCN